MNPSCVTCRYADPAITDDNQPIVRCRRLPPQVFSHGGDVCQCWPQVDETDWCGEWSTR